MLVAIRKYCSDLLWRSHPPKNMGRIRANVTRRTCFSGIFIVNLQGRESLAKPGIPVRRRILLLNIHPLQRALRRLAKKKRAGAEAQFFVLALRPDQSRAVKDRTRTALQPMPERRFIMN